MPPRVSLLPATRAIPYTSPSLSLPQRQLSSSAFRLANAETDTDVDAEVSKIDQLKSDFKRFIRGPGRDYEKPVYNATNYLSKSEDGPRDENIPEGGFRHPFPLNTAFKSAPVLSDELREEIYRRIVGGKSVRHVSAELGVSLERVAAVVRLKAVEKEWHKEKTPVATFLTKALHSMMPVTSMPANKSRVSHEPILDLPVHPFSQRQAFVPTSESREFTRVNAAKEFGLPSPDELVPHPHLVAADRDYNEGVDRSTRIHRQKERDQLELDQKQEAGRRRTAKEREAQVVDSGRWRWTLKPVKTGSVGFRYGVPHQDRKKGQVKIPTRVE